MCLGGEKRGMVAEQVEIFISGLIEKTRTRKLKWKSIDDLENWETIKKQIIKTREVNLDDYFVDDEKSYGIYKNGGYVMVLRLQYGNAPVFSAALYKYILVIKINDDFLPQNITDYDCEGYKDLLQELIKAIEYQKGDQCTMPDCMYEFFGKILGEDENGKLIDE